MWNLMYTSVYLQTYLSSIKYEMRTIFLIRPSQSTLGAKHGKQIWDLAVKSLHYVIPGF